VDKTLECVTSQKKANEQHFNVVLFIMRYKVVLALSPGETLACNHLDQS